MLTSSPVYENYVVSEFVKMYEYSSDKVNLSFYRDTNQKEIDLLIEQNETIHPVEIKKSSNPEKKILNTFRLLSNTGRLSNGAVVCMTDKVFPMDEMNIMIPCNII